MIIYIGISLEKVSQYFKNVAIQTFIYDNPNETATDIIK